MLVFTAHALDQMRERSIPEELVVNTVESPQQSLEAFGRKQIFQSQYLDEVEEKVMLLRVIVVPTGINLED